MVPAFLFLSSAQPSAADGNGEQMRRVGRAVPIAESGERRRLVAPAVVPPERVLIWPVLAGVLLAAASLALCRTAQSSPIDAEGRPPLSYVAKLITIPLVLTSGSDIRSYALPLTLAVALASLAARRSQPRPALASPAQFANRLEWIADWWLELLLLVVIVAGVASALARGSWELSRGWVFQTACGGAWAVLLSRRLTPRRRGSILLVASLIAVAAAAATLWHREVLGLKFVRWPIGPVTLCGALGATWAASAIAFTLHSAVARGGGWRRWVLMAWAAAVACAGAGLMIAAGRRGAFAGCALGVVLGAFLALLPRAGPRSTVALSVAFLLIVGGGGSFWLLQQLGSSQTDAAASFDVRLAYWRCITTRWPSFAFLGWGPDMFVVEGGNDLALARAESPHALHGTVERSAHNEWLQAAFELGVPGGLAYAAIPLIAILGAARAISRGGAPSRTDAAVAAASAAGIAVIVIAESASVNLRYAVMPAWYWTLIGVARAASRDEEGGVPALPRWWPRPGVVRLATAGLAATASLIAANDVFACTAHARGRAANQTHDPRALEWLRFGTSRLGAASCLAAKFDLGVAASNEARVRMASAPNDAGSVRAAAIAVDVWQVLFERCGYYPTAGSRLAEALLTAGRPEEARRTLEFVLGHIHPYEAPAAMLFAQRFETDPVARARLVCQALRSSMLDEFMERTALPWLSEPGALPAWQTRVTGARSDLLRDRPEEWSDSLAPEAMRLESARLASIGELAPAADAACMAADAYGLLHRRRHPLRRASDAEADAWLRSAAAVFRADPGNWQQAYERVCEAERVAMLGMEHEYLRHPDPTGEFVGDVAIPLELPDRFRPLWRLSAKLHLAAGRLRHIELRALSSLPPQMWSAEAAQTVLAELAGELVMDMESLASERRPPHYDRLVELASSGRRSNGAAPSR